MIFLLMAIVCVCVCVLLCMRKHVGGCGAKPPTWLPSWPASRKLPPNNRSCCERPPWRPWHTFTKKYAAAINWGVDYELTAHHVGCVGVEWATPKQPGERWGCLHLRLITEPLISSSRQGSLMIRKGWLVSALLKARWRQPQAASSDERRPC